MCTLLQSISKNRSIAVRVDGIKAGQPVHINYREDIAAFFPGYANSNWAVAYFFLDTTAFQNGVHTIQWMVNDNAGSIRDRLVIHLRTHAGVVRS